MNKQSIGQSIYYNLLDSQFNMARFLWLPELHKKSDYLRQLTFKCTINAKFERPRLNSVKDKSNL